jgi:hypothetical protein
VGVFVVILGVLWWKLVCVGRMKAGEIRRRDAHRFLRQRVQREATGESSRVEVDLFLSSQNIVSRSIVARVANFQTTGGRNLCNFVTEENSTAINCGGGLS